MNNKILFAIIAISLVALVAVFMRQLSTRMLTDRDWESFFKVSDVISYVEILEVEPSINKSLSISEPIPGPLFPEQRAKVKFLKILKGPKNLENTTDTIIKGRAYFYLVEKERLVLYLQKTFGTYYTVGEGSGESRLASVLAYLNSKQENSKSGIIVGILNKGKEDDLEVHILQGRYKAPITLDSETYKQNLVEKEKISEFDIAEIALNPGEYTILLKFEGILYSFNQLIDDYYPYIILEKGQWRAIYFDMKKLV